MERIMGKIEDLQSELKKIFHKQKFAVLATESNGQPYASLMAFVASEDLIELFFATDRDTQKYTNLTANPRVSLLITSKDKNLDVHKTVAITILGESEEVKEEERATLTGMFVSQHSYLESFVQSPSTALFRVKVSTYRVVKEFSEVTNWDLERS